MKREDYAQLHVVWGEGYDEISFTPFSLRDEWTLARRLFYEKYLGFLRRTFKVEVHEVKRYPESVLLLAHDKEYVDYVKRMSELGAGLLDYGDTPAYPGVFEKALLAVSGTLTLADILVKAGRGVAFNPQGGFHHARRRSAGGFCVFNDVAVAARYVRERGYERVAIIDVDAHHGDGTQEILYRDPLLKVSVHGYGYGFYPGTGWIDELGEGDGLCMNINVPIPLTSADDVFELVVRELLAPLISSYSPDFVIVQSGVDAYRGDPLVGLRLTDNSYKVFAEFLSGIAARGVPVLLTGGGGYQPEVTARTWAFILSCVAGRCLEELGPLDEKTSSDRKTVEIVSSRIDYLLRSLKECEVKKR
ncbi:histone deacetylase family protein [Thermofilum pendens]|uniref:Histone deacetylase superfamily n=1 Tax=Thermofilum pendens (strain DSM 2475 / Hrk 5) TaxID=368408 RepID=A1RXP5_THEPD|nr:histone deacetylase [Thermofilum pendens]ABL77975.1 histone deacetylase superfamily [Thermofilum pendens Hrk 5]